jgi:hypothetical protein
VFILLIIAIDVVRVHIVTCDCMPLGVLLVQHGVFPASPTKPHVGVSLDVLDIYRAMFERSCDAIHALAAALHTIYDCRGFTVVSERVSDFNISLYVHASDAP